MVELPNRFETEINRAAELLAQSRNAVALTGAGVSTPSGIPDFRSADSGLWEKHDPMVVATLSAFRRKPENFYDWIRPLIDVTDQAQPNPAHTALAELEQIGPLKGIITQNIDGLHSAAGSRNVYEVHGHVREVECIGCGRSESSAPYLARLAAEGTIPRCPACGSTLKPKVILFGELLPFEIMNRAHAAVEQADLMVIAGSSLEVAPVSELPWLAHQNGAKIIIVNFEPTQIDRLAEVAIGGDVATILPAITARFREISPK